jgi:hypothetical protein
MKQAEDNFNMGDSLLDNQGIGIMHLHPNDFCCLYLFFVHIRKELLHGEDFSAFVHPDDSPCQEAMAFTDGNLVNGKDANPLVVGLAIWSFREPLVDGFDRFTIQPQMPSHLWDGYGLTQLVDVAG